MGRERLRGFIPQWVLRWHPWQCAKGLSGNRMVRFVRSPDSVLRSGGFVDNPTIRVWFHFGDNNDIRIYYKGADGEMFNACFRCLDRLV